MPERVRFHAKPALGGRMLHRAWAAGIPMAWVTGDEVYGDDPVLRDAIARAGRRYVLAVGASTPAWASRPATTAPGVRLGRGGPARTRVRLAPDAPRVTTVKALSAGWPALAWHRLAVTRGEKGPIEYDWASARVVDGRRRVPAEEVWLLARRAVSDPGDVAWYLSNAPDDTPLETLARVASARFVIEQLFEEAKDDVGLDHYEVRSWPAWHRHITLGMLALAWLASIRTQLATAPITLTPEGGAGKKGGPPYAHEANGSPLGRSPKRAG